ncbi:MAG: hypothetical protein M3R17_17700 [Bacteroidota bacterium]|nr:hypothetical protein [Bacteroidota bacterium]
MVEVFKTNVLQADESHEIIQKLLEKFPGCRINFDLEDCDKILRVESSFVPKVKIVLLLNSYGYHCEILS